ncbi:unnamed protein product [Calicophoron daubneyi]|uniref:Cadherin domain-containing protein n=1 Tax=Calicophoron daubneyi TaxID=300641 RepID=A0AAV2TRV7_CALDB
MCPFNPHAAVLLVRTFYILAVAIKPSKPALHTVNFKILEEAPIGTVIGTLTSQLPKELEHDLDKLRFRLVSGEQAHLFILNTTSGELKTKRRLDREMLCSPVMLEDNPFFTSSDGQNSGCQLSFRVNILRLTKSGVDIANLIRVYIDLQDIDDHSCAFRPSDRQSVNFTENANNTKVMLNTPVDLDTNPLHNILISSISLRAEFHRNRSIEKIFKLVIKKTASKTSPFLLSLELQRPLDYEKETEYDLLVNAGGRDRNRNCTLKVHVNVLDQNDNVPTVDKRSVHLHVLENASTFEPIYTIKAQDRDAGPVFGKLFFEFDPYTSQVVKSTFTIVRSNGSLFLRRPLQYSQRSNYKFSVLVRNPSADEDIFSDTEEVSSDSDMAKSVGNEILFVSVEILIDVVDVNDNEPVILVYAPNGSTVLTMREELTALPADFAVVSVSDEDSGRNGETTCQLAENVTSLFSLTRIDSEREGTSDSPKDIGGALYKISALNSFDREASDVLFFTIFCHDYGQPVRSSNATYSLKITDINDNPPQFFTLHLHLQVSEDSDPIRQFNDYYLFQLNATDKDEGENALLTYSFSGSRAMELLTVDSSTGIIRSKGNLDRETDQSLSFTALAIDSGNPSFTASMFVHLQITDFNDHAPHFGEPFYEFEIEENIPEGSLVGVASACDKDFGLNSVLIFWLEWIESAQTNSDPQKTDKQKDGSDIPFRLSAILSPEANCYTVKLFTAAPINRERLMPNRTINPSGYDKQVNRPARISEVPTALYQFVPPDRDSEFSFYGLEIIAEDKGKPPKTVAVKVFVKVKDINDEAPEFVLPTKERRVMFVSKYESPGVELLKVYAVDRDAGLNGTVRYSVGNSDLYELLAKRQNVRGCEPQELVGNGIRNKKFVGLRDFFHINATSGSLTLVKQIPATLDGFMCRLSVIAKDLGRPSLQSHMDVCIIVTDSTPLRRVTGDMALGENHRKRMTNTMFYLYVITAVAVFGLIAAVAFLLMAYFTWHRPHSKRRRHVNNTAQYDGKEFTEGKEKTDFTTQDDTIDHTLDMLGWSNVEFTDSTNQRYLAESDVKAMDPFDLNPNRDFYPTNEATNPTGKISEYGGGLYGGYNALPQSSVYYHTLSNTHALDVSFSSATYPDY